MPDKQIVDLDALTSLTADDLLVVADNPSGTNIIKKITIADAFNYLTRGDLTATAPVALSATRHVIGGAAVVSMAKATTAVDGYLSSTDWNTFNDKEPALTKGNLTATSPIVLSQTRQVIGGAAAVSIPVATTSIDGYLSAVDWTTFNAKQAALSFPLASTLGGTGVNNAGTITNATATTITGGGTLALGGFTLTVPATGTAALLATANVFTAINTFKGTSATDLPTYSAEFLDAADWTSVDWTGDWATGWVHAAGPATALSQAHAAVIGTKYQITYTVVRSAGSFTIAFGGLSKASITATDAWGPTATAVTNLVITPTTTFVGSITISIKSITAESSALMVFRSSEGTNRLEIRTNQLSVNQALGISALANLTTGTKNTAIGAYSLQKLTTGRDNSAVGAYALQNLTTAINCMAFGSYALNAATTGGGNIAIGQSALLILTSGTDNMSIGSYSLMSDLTGYQNVAIGTSALRLATSNLNVGIGMLAGYQLTTGANNTFIGGYAGNDALQLVSASNSMALGYNAYTTGSNNVVIGNTSVVAVGIGTYSPTAHLHIVGVSDTQQLILKDNATQTTNPFELQKSTGAVQISFDDNGGAIFNEAGNATGDFRVESDVYDALFVDASNDSVMVMSNVAGKVGFYAKAAVAQQTHIVDADGSLADATTKINAILVRLETLGLIANA